MSWIHLASGLFFVLTAVCLAVAERYRGAKIAQHAARSALVFVVAAGVLLAAEVPYLGALMDPYHAAKTKHKKKKGGGGGFAGGEEPDTEENGAAEAGAAPVAADSPEEEAAAKKAQSEKDDIEKARQAWEVANDCDILPEMVQVEAGTGRVGAPDGEVTASSIEKPERQVRLWPNFKISRNEITYQQYKCFAEATSRPWKRCSGMPEPRPRQADEPLMPPHVPATCITWQDAKAYAAWLSLRTGKVFRLPSALQWEFAARTREREEAAGIPQDDLAAAQRRLNNMGDSVAEYVNDCWIARTKPGSGEQDDIDQAALQPDNCGTHVLKDSPSSDATKPRQPWTRRRALPNDTSAGIGFRIVQPLGGRG